MDSFPLAMPFRYTNRTMFMRWRGSHDCSIILIIALPNYCPSEPGKTYLFFLNQNDAGGYAPSGFENSRFPLPNAQARSAASIDALTAEDLYLAEGVDLESYKALYREVLEAYAE